MTSIAEILYTGVIIVKHSDYFFAPIDNKKNICIVLNVACINILDGLAYSQQN